MSKAELNVLQTMIDASFYGRSEVWSALCDGRTESQIEVLRAYYLMLVEQAASMPEIRHERAARCVEDAKQAISSGPWLRADAAAT